jgi:hypothetical protein
MREARLVAFLLAQVVLVACASNPPAPPSEPPPSPAPASPGAEPVEPAEPSASEPGTPEPGPAEPEAAPEAELASRDVRYFLSSDGLRVEVTGVAFSVAAAPVKLGRRWGVSVQAEVVAKDKKEHSLLAPEGAELAFAGRVQRKSGGEPESFSDERPGDRALPVIATKAVTLRRSWPEKGGAAALEPGDELELAVGVWGIGDDAASRRPLRGLCKVTLKFNQSKKPRALVALPDGVSR